MQFSWLENACIDARSFSFLATFKTGVVAHAPTASTLEVEVEGWKFSIILSHILTLRRDWAILSHILTLRPDWAIPNHILTLRSDWAILSYILTLRPDGTTWDSVLKRPSKNKIKINEVKLSCLPWEKFVFSSEEEHEILQPIMLKSDRTRDICS